MNIHWRDGSTGIRGAAAEFVTAVEVTDKFGFAPAGDEFAAFAAEVTEALHNVVKHSGATEMRFGLTIESSQLVVRVEDNGRGFDVSARTGAGNGLGNMHRRMADLGGSFEVQSAPGQGTRIQIRAPLPASTVNL